MHMDASQTPEAEEDRTILVVDDDPALLRLVKLVLGIDGYHICTAPHGLEALDALDRCDPDLIVLDIEMPVMDGPTFMQRLREQGRRTPVLVLSANSGTAARALDADAYLPKPFVPEQLSAKIRRLIAA